jgi:hypothetical protein
MWVFCGRRVMSAKTKVQNQERQLTARNAAQVCVIVAAIAVVD